MIRIINEKIKNNIGFIKLLIYLNCYYRFKIYIDLVILYV